MHFYLNLRVCYYLVKMDLKMEVVLAGHAPLVELLMEEESLNCRLIRNLKKTLKAQLKKGVGNLPVVLDIMNSL